MTDTAESTSFKETQSKITPYAFTVAPQLLDLPLARPFRRCIAILLDLLLIAIASEFVSEGSGALLLLAAWLAHKYMPADRFRQLSWVALSLLFVVIIGFSVASYDDEEVQQTFSNGKTAAEVLKLTPDLISLGSCEDKACAFEAAAELRDTAEETRLEPELVNQMITEALPVELVSFEPDDYVRMGIVLAEQRNGATDNGEATQAGKKILAEAEVSPKIVLGEGNISPEADEAAEATPVSWLKGALADLGLRFSWAAIYFSIFTAWFNGKTPGKKLLGIRVIRLDGQAMTVWNSFGRYGGYTAGLATGLLGFLQIYWDPNRQAIQDKISATAVIRD